MRENSNIKCQRICMGFEQPILTLGVKHLMISKTLFKIQNETHIQVGRQFLINFFRTLHYLFLVIALIYFPYSTYFRFISYMPSIISYSSDRLLFEKFCYFLFLSL